MDELDRAQQELEQQLASTLNSRKQERAAEAVVPSAYICNECGDFIPNARRIAILGCQQKLERVKSLRS